MNIYDLSLLKKKLFSKKRPSNDDKSKNILINQDKFAVVESYKQARTNLMFSISAKDAKAVVFTSANKSEGKSTSITNMAISMSKMGKKVLLIDADLRKPNIHNLLKLKNEHGLSEVLGRFKTVDEVLIHSALPNLDVLTAGSIPPNPSELLASNQMKKVLKNFEVEYDFILIDSPPVGMVTDATMLKDEIAGYVLVVREQSTTHNDIDKTLSILKLADSNVLGFLKVGCSQKDRKYYKKYGYKRKYGYYNYNYNY